MCLAMCQLAWWSDRKRGDYQIMTSRCVNDPCRICDPDGMQEIIDSLKAENERLKKEAHRLTDKMGGLWVCRVCESGPCYVRCNQACNVMCSLHESDFIPSPKDDKEG